MRNFGKRTLLKIIALAATGTALSGCVYDVGLGYASDGHYDDYGCDPYGGYDSYYDCDYGSGFFNIGFGGGWYDSYWYPGHGYYLFDNYGRRHIMREHHRRYWGGRRHSWYRENRGRHGDRGRYQDGRRGYSGNPTPGAIGWPENNGGRVRDDDDRRGRREGRRGRNDQWRGGDGNGANAVPAPNPDIVQGSGRGRDRGNRYGRPPGGDGPGRRGERSNDNVNAVPQPDQPTMDRGGRGDGGGRVRAPSQSAVSDQPVAAPRVAPAPRAERPRPAPARRQPRDGGERVREQ